MALGKIGAPAAPALLEFIKGTDARLSRMALRRVYKD